MISIPHGVMLAISGAFLASSAVAQTVTIASAARFWRRAIGNFTPLLTIGEGKSWIHGRRISGMTAHTSARKSQSGGKKDSGVAAACGLGWHSTGEGFWACASS